MRLILLLVVVTLWSAPAVGQPDEASPVVAAASSTSQDATALDLPVSFDRIRELLARAPAESLLQGLDRQPDFSITVEERRFLKDILETLDVKAAPAPPGGLYGYETDRQVSNTRSSPLARPYAAFTSGELAQLSLTSIVSALVTRYLTNGVRRYTRTQAEALAQADVRQAIDDYCRVHPERALIAICHQPALR
jgi:hypothetical protein